MSSEPQPHQCSSKDRFRLHFQHGMREYLARHSASAYGFAVVWEKTLADIRLHEREQAEVYWDLLDWLSSYNSFTSGQKTPWSP